MLSKLSSIFVFAALMASLTYAQQFQGPTYYPVLSASSRIASADFNNDGFADFVVFGNGVPFQAQVFLNQGDGTFIAGAPFNIPNVIYALTVADLNEDGKTDLLALVLSGSSNWALSVFLGNGDGTFAFAHSYKVGAVPEQFVVADFNHDKHQDVAVLSLPGGIMVFPGNGKGELGKADSYRGTTQPMAIAAADVNGDGRPDLVVTGGPGTLAVLLNNGKGKFSNGSALRIDSSPQSVVLGDLNHDGKVDVVVSSVYSRGIDVLLGNGDGTFGAPTFYSLASIGWAPITLVLRDFNLDGKLDVAATMTTGSMALLYGNGDGTLQNPVPISIQSNNSYALISVDFDNDGAADLAATTADGNVGIFLNTQ